MSELDELAVSAFIRAQADMKEVLHYNPHTGVFTWLKDGRNHKAGERVTSRSKSKYLRITLFGKSYPAHRLAWLYVHGSYPGLVDHINGNPEDNRIANLRECTRADNARNRRKAAGTLSGRTGVYISNSSGRWTARIGVNGQRVNLGTFDDPERAEDAYRLAALRYHNEFAAFYSREELALIGARRERSAGVRKLSGKSQAVVVDCMPKKQRTTIRTA